MGIFQIALLPFTFLYSLGVRLRNHLYNISYSRSFKFEIPVVVVGNLSVGGTGKTPMVEFLIRLLSTNYNPAILSRGYRRRTKGFVLADDTSTSDTIGDEPMQYYRKFNNPVAVCEDRLEAIPKILFERPATDLIIMDDGFQHRAVNPFLSILLTDANRLFTKDFLIPSGRLREPRKEARRADLIVVTKCNENISEEEFPRIQKEISKYAEGVPVFFSFVSYGKPKELQSGSENKLENKSIILVTGIANPDPFVSFLTKDWNIKKHFRFPDHHVFSMADIKDLVKEQKRLDACVFTTEKDAVRLKEKRYNQLLAGVPIFYIAITSGFIKNGSEFDQKVLSLLQSFSH